MKWVKKVVITIIFIIVTVYVFMLSYISVFMTQPKGPPAWQEWEDAYGHQPIK